jgi:hypothetical protein
MTGRANRIVSVFNGVRFFTRRADFCPSRAAINSLTVCQRASRSFSIDPAIASAR